MKVGLAPLVACVALLFSSACVSGHREESYMNYDTNQHKIYNFQTTETLGESIAAATDVSQTESVPTEPVTMSPELKKIAGIENGAVVIPSGDMLKTTIKKGFTSTNSNATSAPTTAQTQDDPVATKGDSTEGISAPNNPLEDPAASSEPYGNDESTKTQKTTDPPKPTPKSTPAPDDNKSKNEGEKSSGASQSPDTHQANPAATPPTSTQPADQSQYWTPGQSNNEQPAQDSNNEAPQPTQPPQPKHNEAPQPTQPPQPKHIEAPQPTQPPQPKHIEAPQPTQPPQPKHIEAPQPTQPPQPKHIEAPQPTQPPQPKHIEAPQPTQPPQPKHIEAPQPTQPPQPKHIEAPQPTQPPQPQHNEAPQPTQPPQTQSAQPGLGGSSQVQNAEQGSVTHTQTESTSHIMTTSVSGQDSKHDSSNFTESTVSASSPSHPVSKCKARH
ncbi:unnamed protein product [Peronospora belbahrii]|uniref:Uncharacterized protein n=1 Tax=Peronospora belbahrii TaxID=622444 RepID=A0AAU9KZK7_9STRA|nr:unnamed protein product [Peronospora belbahrii]CAH0516628.1 unnamed protein product [Peronospora belbahrii]